MCNHKKWLIGMVLLVFSSVGMAEQIATSFIYPVGNSNSPPTEQKGNANGFWISQGFNTDPSIGGVNGGWCANSSFVQISYGDQTTCETKGFRWVYGHTGADMSTGVCGAEIHATANGTVDFSGIATGYGNLLKLKHTLPNGLIIYSLYGHRSDTKVVNLAFGQLITKGQIVGYVGHTGAGDNCHIHFAVYDDAIRAVPGITNPPVGYVYDDKTGKTSSGAVIPPNIIRYFYDSLLFVSDRNNDWHATLPGAQYWSINFSNSQSVTTRTMYVVNGAGEAKSLQSAVNAGWINSVLYWWNGSALVRYTNPQPIDSYTIQAGVPYAFGMLRTDLTLHWFLAGNDYLDARWRGDMAEFTNVNSSLGFGRALRETYGNNPSWDTTYGLAVMLYEQTVNGSMRNAYVYIAYSKTDPQVRLVSYYSSFTATYSAWVRVY